MPPFRYRWGRPNWWGWPGGNYYYDPYVTYPPVVVAGSNQPSPVPQPTPTPIYNNITLTPTHGFFILVLIAILYLAITGIRKQ